MQATQTDRGAPLRERLVMLEEALLADGYTHNAADRHVGELVTYATMCRAKTDAPPGAFRDFATRACGMTRRSRCMSDMWISETPILAAACDALHDLIMEGV